MHQWGAPGGARMDPPRGATQIGDKRISARISAPGRVQVAFARSLASASGSFRLPINPNLTRREEMF